MKPVLHYSPLIILLAAAALCISACGGNEPEATDSFSWDPELDEDQRGLLDLGTASLGEMINGQITLTNISEETVTVIIEADLDAAIGFNASTPVDGIDVEPGDDFSWGPMLTPLASTPSDPSGEVTFQYDEQTVIYDVIATVE